MEKKRTSCEGFSGSRPGCHGVKPGNIATCALPFCSDREEDLVAELRGVELLDRLFGVPSCLRWGIELVIFERGPPYEAYCPVMT